MIFTRLYKNQIRKQFAGLILDEELEEILQALQISEWAALKRLLKGDEDPKAASDVARMISERLGK